MHAVDDVEGEITRNTPDIVDDIVSRVVETLKVSNVYETLSMLIMSIDVNYVNRCELC